MNLLYIVNVWPEPQTSGASARVLQLLDCFQKAHFTITVVSSANKTDNSALLENSHIRTAKVEINSTCFDEFVKTLNPTIVVFDRFLTEEKFGWRVAIHCPHALRILDTIDLHSLRDARAEAYKKNTSLEHHNPTSLREIAAIFRCDLTLFVGDYELDYVEQHFNVPANLLYYHPFAIEPQPQAQLPTFEQRQDFISIGSFLHPPNWDAVLQLKQKIWPQIRAQLPKATLHIYGSYTPEKAKQLHNEKEGFVIEGFAQNSHQVMQNARVHLAPLSFGAGIKSKCVLAFETLTPTITTTVGTEGLDPFDAWGGKISNNVDTFIDNAVAMYQSKMMFTDAQRNCQAILNHFAQQDWQQKLLKKIEQLQTHLSAHRSTNFIGKMMLHHQHLSTKYMSKWIEQKNAIHCQTS